LYLKSLTIRGFKSFASSTTLQLEPGITAVVGPNGSGKSNVVDALAWVMGEQGAKSLRGGKMEDVIFAGTSGRPPLGRAEVVLTIDNTDGALPIEYSEVTISRTLFRNGGSEYAINGSSCRLLDVQELLSDSGIGREMHVVVGQGQLDSVLRATPEERRGFVEEAAGVLKHRKRKEKALRKLEATQGNLTRLQDLLTELRRQLKPLGRQAEVARRAVVIQADVRDARARLLADDLATALEQLQTELADESALRERREAVEAAIAQARQAEAEVEERLAADSPALSAAQETWYQLSGLRERIRGTLNLAQERVRMATSQADDRPQGRDPDDIEADADEIQSRLDALREAVAQASAELEQAVAARGEAETAYSTEERRIAGLLRAAADRREGLARLHGQVNAAQSRVDAAGQEITRLEAARDEATQRSRAAQQEYTALESTIAGLFDGEGGLDREHEEAEAEAAALATRLEDVRSRIAEAERSQAALTARKDALESGLARKDGAGALLAVSDEVNGLLGSVAALLTVLPGFEKAVAEALGTAADAVAVEGLDGALGAMARLKDEDLGRAGMLLAGGPVDDTAWPGLPDGATYALDVVDAPDALRPALARLLFKVAVVDDLEAARSLVHAEADVTAVTREGDVLGAHFAHGGSGKQQSLLEVQAAIEKTTAELADVTASLERLRFELSSVQAEHAEAQDRVEAALARLHESDAEVAAVASKLEQLGSTVTAAKAEAERLETARARAAEAREKDEASLAELADRLEQAESAPEEEPDTAEMERLAEAASTARKAEMDARLALRTNEERATSLTTQVTNLRQAAEAERQARAKAAERRERLRREAEAAGAVVAAGEPVLERLGTSIDAAAAVRAEIEEGRRGREHELRDVRARLRELSTELETLTNAAHKDELARAEKRLRIEALTQRAQDELGLEPDTLVAEFGPEVRVPVLDEPSTWAPAAEDVPEPEPAPEPVERTGDADDPDAEPAPRTVPYVRAQQEKRLRQAEKNLAMLGKVNPLALEEFSALEERHQFLSDQLDDLRRTRQDLMEIVQDVDVKVEEVFTAAWHDVEREFTHVFSRLFPGGEGRILLTDPDNMLTTGIDVEARPPGKKVKRLSLLSGGERSLVAVAFLVALFKARPSPFYILDEVEAALDDTNLGRLLEIYEELRESSQLIVITHQKRTMEVADALYGVSMRGDGVSAVISQRLREEEPA
jgi:chromosome segregation protein